MSTTPVWFDENYYLSEKADQLNEKWAGHTESEVLSELGIDVPDGSVNDDGVWTSDEVSAVFSSVNLTPYEHYVQYGDGEGVAPNEFFNPEFYVKEQAQYMLQHNPDVQSAVEGMTDEQALEYAENYFLETLDQLGMTTYEHFHEYGWQEGLDPSPSFDVDSYFQAKLNALQNSDNPDVAAQWADKTVDDLMDYFAEQGLDPVEHYELYGQDEGFIDLHNVAPQAQDDDLTEVLDPVNPGDVYYVDFANILTNDTDADGDTLTIDKVVPNGEVEGVKLKLVDSDDDGVNDKVAIILPEDYAQDTFSFKYVVNDGHDHKAAATVTLAVGSEPPAIDVNVEGEGSVDAAAHDYVYHFTPGTYTYEIQNFGNGDVLVFPEGATPTVVNDNFTDGKVIVQWAHEGNTIQVELTGLSEDVDGSLLFLSDFQYDETSHGYTLPEQETGGGEGGGETGGGELTPNTINVTPEMSGNEYTAADDVAETFVFQEGNYEYTINGFDLNNDVLDLPDNPSPTVINNDFSDGEVTVQWAGNGQTIEVHLVGLTADQDGSLLFASDFGDALA